MSQWARAIELAQMRFAESALKAAIGSAAHESSYLNEVVAVALEATEHIAQPEAEASVRDPRAVLLSRIQRARRPAKEIEPSGGRAVNAIASWTVMRRVRREAGALSRRAVPPSPEGLMTELRVTTNRGPLGTLLRTSIS